MTWKKHPGIFFFLYSIESSFMMGLMFGLINLPEIIERSIMFVWAAMMFYGVTYYHVKWIESIDKKYYKGEK